MLTHAHFEELSVLATAGGLSPAESAALEEHLAACNRCRSFFADAHRVSDCVLPRALPASRQNVAQVPAGMRERFLARAASQGRRMEAGEPVAASAESVREKGMFVGDAPPAFRTQPFSHSGAHLPRFFGIRLPEILNARGWAMAGLACVACFVLGLELRNQVMRNPVGPQTRDGREISVPQFPAPRVTSAAATDLDKVRALTRQRDQLVAQVADLAQQVETVQENKTQTETALRQQLAQSKSDDHDTLAQQLAALNLKAGDLQSQLDAARQAQSVAEVELKNARDKSSEYAARLDLAQTQLHSQETAASLPRNSVAGPVPGTVSGSVASPVPSEVASLVAARNLHIIDVYDSNSNGRRQRPFGRVFYVEGRSLVFYAYDLNTAHAEKNITFHLWGEKAGSKETTLSLGVLHDDDPREGRWALTCNDPQVLGKINSVYVTAESGSKQADAPRGPRVLYAYFGAPPNHP